MVVYGNSFISCVQTTRGISILQSSQINLYHLLCSLTKLIEIHIQSNFFDTLLLIIRESTFSLTT
jgi:hypothetical protein